MRQGAKLTRAKMRATPYPEMTVTCPLCHYQMRVCYNPERTTAELFRISTELSMRLNCPAHK